MSLPFNQEKNNIAEYAEGRAPSTAQRQPLHHKAERQREQERQAHTDRTTKRREQERTMRQTQISNNTTREQDKTREQQIVKQIKLKKKRCRK